MDNVYLSAEEIYAIDNFNEKTFSEYVLSVPPEKREVAAHLYYKNQSLKMLKYLADERDEDIKRLLQKLHDLGESL